MPTEIGPKDVQLQIQHGFDRFRNFRSARLMFLRNYTGQYYDRTSGTVGSEPLNLIFNAIRILVPHIVMSFPKHAVETPYLSYRQYADLLGLTLEQHDKQVKITDIYRRWIVDAIFTLGIVKTGLAQSGSVYALNEYDQVDQGTIYTECVDFDNFVADPKSKEHLFRDAGWLGDRLCVPRQMLLDSGSYKNDLVERLPSVSEAQKQNRASYLSQRNLKDDDIYGDEDYVEIVEAWVRGANALITVPGSDDVVFDDYLRVDDYYGPKEGPYSLLALTPPVPGNPLPVPSVGVWNDLHVLANRMAKKIVEQAERQKDIVAYKSTSADDAEELKNASDGEAVKVDDPDGVKTLSFGGQQNSNDSHLMALQGWFNMMSANPEMLGGAQDNSGSATAANILQTNASVGLEDVKNLVYQAAVDESSKRAWYFHTDPMIQMPLTQRIPQQAQYMQGAGGQLIMLSPPTMVEQQVVLTPEARRGDFMDFAFAIEPESMGRVDSRVQFAQMMDFATKIMPAVATTAQTMMMLGIPFSAKAFIMRAAKKAGINWLDEVFYDPEFQMQLAQQQMMGPQMQNSKGQVGPPQQPQGMMGGMGGAMQPGGNMMDQILQNGQPSNLPNNPSPDAQDRSTQQSGAVDSQHLLSRLTSRNLTSPMAYTPNLIG